VIYYENESTAKNVANFGPVNFNKKIYQATLLVDQSGLLFFSFFFTTSVSKTVFFFGSFKKTKKEPTMQ
jgi:hypothetical protein